MKQLCGKVALAPWIKLTSYEKHLGDITNPGAANERVFLTCMKLPIYRFDLLLFIAVLLPRAVPGGRHEVARAVLIRNEFLSTHGDNLVVQTAQEQDQTQQQEQQQGEQAVIRFIRDPDPAPEFAVKASPLSAGVMTSVRRLMRRRNSCDNAALAEQLLDAS